MQLEILTIGHSTRPFEEFIELLKAQGVRLVADVRTIPGSRRNPQFNREEMEKGLQSSGLGYVHMKGLGGLRHAKKDSLNRGWENASFRGFADYMQTKEFEESLEKLIEAAKERRTAIMCAEALPWRCHRSLVSDALLVRGTAVFHIMSKTSVKTHVLTPWASARGTSITYPKPAASAQPDRETS